MNNTLPTTLLLLLLSGGLFVHGEEEPLFIATPLTRPGEFTQGIEGPACDRAGNVCAVNFGTQGTVGLVTPAGQAGLWVTLPKGSTGNGLRFDRAGFGYVADHTGHNILRIDPATRAVSTFAHEPRMSQPNDIAIGPDGILYASDPDWKAGTGRIWRIGTDGRVSLLAGDLGTTNGIEVSPDGQTLYVNESAQRKVWAFRLGKAFRVGTDSSLGDKRLLKEFPDHGFDGMRCDVDGNLYLTRHGKGTVVKLSPEGEILREIDVLGAYPSNLCFGGPDGRTVYVTEVAQTRIVQFRVDRPGLSWQRWQESASDVEASIPPGTVDLVILAGQSNAVGFDANAADLPSDPNDGKVLFWWRAGDPPPDIHDTTSGGVWTTLRPQPVGHAHPPKDPKTRQYGNFGQPLGGFGPEIGFARAVMDRQPERRLAVVKTAFSGTGIARDWDPDAKDDAGACYRALVGECQRAIAAAKARGILLRPTAFLWVQGESDANATDAPLYAARLKHLLASLRKDLAAPALPALLAVNTRFGLGKNPHMPAIVEAQQQVEAADPLAAYVDTASATVINPFHFDAAGTLDVGRRFARALSKLEAAPPPP